MTCALDVFQRKKICVLLHYFLSFYVFKIYFKEQANTLFLEIDFYKRFYAHAPTNASFLRAYIEQAILYTIVSCGLCKNYSLVEEL